MQFPTSIAFLSSNHECFPFSLNGIQKQGQKSTSIFSSRKFDTDSKFVLIKEISPLFPFPFDSLKLNYPLSSKHPLRSPTAMDFDCAEQSRRGKRVKLEDDDSVDTLARLPRELVTEILSKLPVSSLVNFTYVCRSWRSLAQDPFVVTHISSITKNNQCLIFHCDTPIRSELCCVNYDTPGNIQKLMNFLPTFSCLMPEFDVVASCDGVLCLLDSLFGNKLSLYNPLTNCFKQLPKPPKYPNQEEEAVIGFGFLQKTKEFKVVQFVNKPFSISKVLILTLGSSGWREIGQVAYHFVQCTSQVFVNERLHWLTQPHKYRRSHYSSPLVSFDLANEVFEEVPKPSCEALNKYEYHLLVIKGCLSAAFFCKRGKLEIWVMKSYGVKESWSKEYSIGKHVPKGINLRENVEWDWRRKFLKTLSRARDVRVLCVLNNGDILLEYKGKALATYEPRRRKFKDIKIQGTPKLFQVVHAGSFNWNGTVLHNRA